MGNDVVTLDANTDVCYVVRCISGIVGGVRSVKQQQQPTSLSRQPYVSRNEQSCEVLVAAPTAGLRTVSTYFSGNAARVRLMRRRLVAALRSVR